MSASCQSFYFGVSEEDSLLLPFMVAPEARPTFPVTSANSRILIFIANKQREPEKNLLITSRVSKAYVSSRLPAQLRSFLHLRSAFFSYFPNDFLNQVVLFFLLYWVGTAPPPFNLFPVAVFPLMKRDSPPV